ncbi:MAG: cell division protein ZapE, partial [Alphaproteobacteria bacterium]|nr:cell division protein ZapE [Alphaproteobacteria bacterium]
MDTPTPPEISPIEAYRALLEDGSINPDASQRQAMERLQDLSEALTNYAPQMSKQGWMTRLKMGRGKLAVPQGLYMWGGVGRGKSMLMDLFFDTVTEGPARQRVHFHAFM